MANNGEKQYNKYLEISKRDPTDVLNWQRANLSKALNDRKIEGEDAEDALTYWASLPRPRPKIPPSTAPPTVVKFWNELSNAKLTEGKGKGKKKASDKIAEPTFLELASGTHFLGDERLGSKLFVRGSYKGLAAVTFGILDGGKNAVITGNPGIGKSFFLFYFLYLLQVREPEATVVVYRHLEKRWYLFSKEGAFTQVGEAEGYAVLEPYLMDPNAWYLVDTATPLRVRAKTLLVSSPYEKRYKEFCKENTHIRYMPIWNKAELDICRQEFYHDTVTQDKLNELHQRWGGIYRYVLEKANNEDNQRELDGAISKCTTQDILKYAGAEASMEHISHKLLHLIVEDEDMVGEMQLTSRYSTIHIDVASKYVTKRLTEKFGHDVRSHLELLRGLQGRHGAGVLFGHLYEYYAHVIISQGGQFRVRNLTTNKISTLRLKRMETKYLLEVENISTVGPGEYGQGHNTLPVVSSPPLLFNMTANNDPHRGLNGNGLKISFSRLPEETFRRPCKYYWVVPSNLFESFQKQTATEMRGGELDLLVNQFVLELSISDTYNQRTSVTKPIKRKGKDQEEDDSEEEMQASTSKKTRHTKIGESGVCKAILQGGKNEGMMCGRTNCPYHSHKEK
eukprot:Phypoly_transcript_04370.p1 GENE.Phypoly_transcript_04370~~Phypoly_transcript_04370.p1  ORF type:complete len:622 (+),score=82.74 Phypoly_transcript_04370:133-1998(+)